MQADITPVGTTTSSTRIDGCLAGSPTVRPCKCWRCANECEQTDVGLSLVAGLIAVLAVGGAGATLSLFLGASLFSALLSYIATGSIGLVTAMYAGSRRFTNSIR
jgi:hypothetical protein